MGFSRKEKDCSQLDSNRLLSGGIIISLKEKDCALVGLSPIK